MLNAQTLLMWHKSSPLALPFNPEATLTLTGTFPVGAIIFSTEVDRSVPCVFAADFTALDGSAGGMIYEQGASGVGAYVGFGASGQFRARCGRGNVPPANQSAILTAPAGVVGGNGTLVWEFGMFGTARTRAWWNGTLLGAVSALLPHTAIWAGTNPGRYLDPNPNIPVGEIPSLVPYGTASPLRYYENQTVP
jgi:hypothetical protein